MNQYESNAFKDHMCQNCLPKEILFQCLGLWTMMLFWSKFLSATIQTSSDVVIAPEKDTIKDELLKITLQHDS